MVWRHHASQADAARELVPPRSVQSRARRATCQGPEKKVECGVQSAEWSQPGSGQQRAGVRGEWAVRDGTEEMNMVSRPHGEQETLETCSNS